MKVLTDIFLRVRSNLFLIGHIFFGWFTDYFLVFRLLVRIECIALAHAPVHCRQDAFFLIFKPSNNDLLVH